MSFGVRQVWLADDAAVGEKIQPLFGYLVNSAKSWLIAKTKEAVQEAKGLFWDTVNRTKTSPWCHSRLKKIR